jgi:hypothetical protein
LQGEKITDKSPVIRKEVNSLVEKPIALSANSISWLINELLDKSGIRPRSENKRQRTSIMQCHGFRKFFETTARLAGMDLSIINRCMGHNSGLDYSYLKLSEEDLLEGNDHMPAYISAIDSLTIYNENRLQRKIKEMEVHHTEEWELLRREIGELRQKFLKH